MADGVASFVSKNVRVHHLGVSRVLGYVALAGLVAPMLFVSASRMLGAQTLSGIGSFASMALFAFSPIAAIWALVDKLGGFGRAATIAVGENVEIIGPKQRRFTIPKRHVVGGFVAPTKKGARVELSLADGKTMVASVASLLEGERLLDSLELDASHRRARIRLASETRRIGVGLLVFVVTLFFWAFIIGGTTHGAKLSDAGFFSWLLAQIASTWMGIAATRPPEVIVGHEGFEIVRTLRRRYIAYQDVERVDKVGADVVVSMKGGEKIRLGGGVSHDASRIDALLLRLREAMAARVSEPLAAAKLALVERNGRSIAVWKHDLERATANGSAYREALLSDDDLCAIVDSPAASSEQRIGAAIALATRDTASARERLSRTAACVANPKLRVALESAGTKDQEAWINAALEAEAEHEAESERAAVARIRV